MTDLPQSIARLQDQISDYLSCGGLFNPESMEHSKVRDLLIDCRGALESRATAPVEVDEVRADIQDAIDIVDMCLPMGPIDHRVDAVVGPICKRLGYGAVMASASRQWRVMDNGGAFISGPCVSTAKVMRDRLAKALITLGQGDAQAKETK